jgi:hypothetical protein
MGTRMSRRGFMRAAGGAATIPLASSIAESASEEFRSEEQATASAGDRIVDIHVHFDEKNPNFIRDFLALAERINLTACLLTPYSRRVQVAEAAKQHPKQIVPFGFIDLDATDVLSQVKDLHELGYRGNISIKSNSDKTRGVIRNAILTPFWRNKKLPCRCKKHQNVTNLTTN